MKKVIFLILCFIVLTMTSCNQGLILDNGNEEEKVNQTYLNIDLEQSTQTLLRFSTNLPKNTKVLMQLKELNSQFGMEETLIVQGEGTSNYLKSSEIYKEDGSVINSEYVRIILTMNPDTQDSNVQKIIGANGELIEGENVYVQKGEDDINKNIIKIDYRLTLENGKFSIKK